MHSARGLWAIAILFIFVANAIPVDAATRQADGFEPNNDPDHAGTISEGFVSATIYPVGDIDWYTFTLAESAYVNVNVTNVPAAIDPVLVLYGPNSNSTVVATADSGGSGGAEYIFRLLSAGNYYVRVSDYNNDDQSTSSYRLGLMLGKDIYEPNDDGASAYAIGTGTYSPTLHSASDVDFFKFTLAGFTYVTVNITSPPSVDVTLAIYGPNSYTTLINTSQNPGLGASEQIFAALSAGTYYIRVHSVLGYSIIESYSMTLKFHYDQFEPNDGGTTAYPLNEGMHYPTIYPVGDIDWYTFYISSQTMVFINVTNVPSALDLVLQLYGPNTNTTLIASADSASGGGSEQIYRQLGIGTYYVRIYEYNNDASSTSPFRLGLSFGLDPYEPNDDGTSAYAITEGNYTPTIFPECDRDWFKFTIPSSCYVTLNVSSVPASLDMILSLFGPNSATSLIGRWNNATEGGFERLTLFLQAGTYYALVNATSGACNISSYNLQYRLHTDPYEPNDNGTSAFPISEGIYTPTIFPAGDNDWFSFYVPSTKMVYINMTNIPGSIDPVLMLYGPNSTTTIIQTADYGGPNVPESIYRQLGQGTYYIRAYDYSNNDYSTITYTLGLNIEGDAYEPNNDGPSAYAVTEGNYTPTMNPESDFDWFKFTIASQTYVTLRLSNVPSGVDLVLKLYGPNSYTTMISMSDVGGLGGSERIFAVLSAGTYYALVHSGAGATNEQPYTLTLSYHIDEFENNDIGAYAYPLPEGSYLPTIYPAGDNDWFAFTLSSTTMVHANVTNVPADIDIVLVLYGPNSTTTVIQTSDSSGSGGSEYFYRQLGAGTYYMRVYDYQNDDFSTSAYRLTLRYGIDIYEWNDNATSSYTITSGNYTPTMYPAGDRDWFSFSLGTTSYVLLDLTNVPTAVDIVMALYGPNSYSTLIDASDIGGLGGSERIWEVLASGTYYVKIYSTNGTAIGETYKLMLGMNQDEYEVNNDGPSAYPIGPMVIYPTLFPIGDQDWFTFILPSETTIYANVTNVPANVDPVLQLYGPDSYSMLNYTADSYSNGGSERFNRTLVAGTYYIRIYEYNNDGESALPYTFSLNTSLQPVPTIFSCGLAPMNGSVYETFTYRLTYYHMNNVMPTYVRVIIDGVPYEMSKKFPTDTDYTDGCIYVYSTSSLVVGAHNFRFEVSDGLTTVAMPVVGNFTGPTVVGPNTAPSLYGCGVSPSLAEYGSTFTFTVNYSDAENNAPAYVKLFLDGVGYSMTKQNALDNTYFDGCTYIYSTSALSIGTHQYYFVSSDGAADARAPAIGNYSGPTIVAPNTAPSLSSGNVTPTYGTTLTTYVYAVTYTDADDDAPAYVRVFIDGTQCTMTKQNAIDNVYSDGCIYEYSSSSLSTGTHTYRFECSDGEDTTALPSLGELSGPTVVIPNNLPSLANGTISPSTGTTSTIFVYNVTYTDIDDNAPLYVNVIIDGAAHNMTKQNVGDVTYSDGCLYTYSSGLPIGVHTYYFEAHDGLGCAILPDFGVYNGPTVQVLNSPPVLLLGAVSPSSGTTATDFIYTVNYTDTDNDAPQYVNVFIDGLAHNMTKQNAGDITYSDGCIYIYDAGMLSFGSHTYRFACSDGAALVSLPPSGTYTGPTVSESNTAPTLSSGYVSPSSGMVGSTFVFNVTYSDFEDDGPSLANVFIDGMAYAMTKLNAGDVTYTDGCVYVFSTSSLSAGTHNYYFEFSDGVLSARLPTSGSFSGPAISEGPVTIPPLLFSEVMYNPLGNEADEEWLELYNPADFDVNLTGFKIFDNLGVYIFPSGTSIPGESTIIVARNSTAFHARYGIFPQVSGFNLTLTNSGDVLRLTMPNGVEIDMVAWGGYIPGWNISASENRTIERCPPGQDTNTSADWISNSVPTPNETAQPNVPPTAVTLNTPTGAEITPTTIALDWVQNNDADFARYEVHRATTPAFAPSNATLVNTITNQYTNSYTVIGLSSSTSYYFKVRVVDVGALYADSNEVSATTLAQNAPPSLSSPSVTPSSGNISTSFTYAIIYTDANNDAPAYVNVSIDGTQHAMTKQNDADNTYTDGCIYIYTTTLAVGSHTYAFISSDGAYATNAPPTGTYSGPLVSQPGNNAPTLSPCTVFPTTGNTSTIFYFNATYADIDDEAPAFVRVYIDGTMHAMEKSNFSDSTYSDGCDYTFSTTLAAGVHQFHFETNDSHDGVRLPADGEYDGPTVSSIGNNAPYFSDASVTPNSGSYDTTFTFAITYTDIDNDAPVFVNVIIDGIAHNMSKLDPLDNVYTDGCSYTYATTLLPGYHTYKFVTHDGKDEVYTPQANTGLVTGQNNAPNLYPQAVSPSTGSTETTFTYTVIYIDADNDAPTYVKVFIDGTDHDMVKSDNSDVTYTDGCGYTYSTTLALGTHTYYFASSDGRDNTQTPTMSGPNVTSSNEPPSLSSQSFSPLSGNVTVDFTFSVVYSDPDNDAPSYVKVILDGISHDMIKTDPSDASYIDGSAYYYTTKLSAGVHAYSFIASDGLEEVVLPLSGTFSTANVTEETFTNTPPTLTNGTMDPSTGNTTTIFTFTVVYTDANNDAPGYIVVIIDGVEHMMTKVTPSDIDYTDGCVYQYTTTLPQGTHNYSFKTSDGTSSQQYPPSGSTTSVITEPHALNHAPALSSCSVSPASGRSGATFTFRVTYTDEEGDAPAYVRAIVDGKTYEMNKTSGDYKAGATYEVKVKLKTGKHTFYFMTSDGNATNSTIELSGPKVASSQQSTPGFTGALVACTLAFCIAIIVVRRKRA